MNWFLIISTQSEKTKQNELSTSEVGDSFSIHSTVFFAVKAMNYLENYSFVAKLVETYKKSMPNSENFHIEISESI